MWWGPYKSMLVTYIVIVVIGTIIYTVIKIIISELKEEPGMNPSDLKRSQNNSFQDYMHCGTIKSNELNTIEISDDDSSVSLEQTEESSTSSTSKNVSASSRSASKNKKNTVRRRRRKPVNNKTTLSRKPHIALLPDTTLSSINGSEATESSKKSAFKMTEYFSTSKDNHVYQPLQPTECEQQEKKRKCLFSWNEPSTNKHNTAHTSTNYNSDSSDEMEFMWKVKGDRPSSRITGATKSVKDDVNLSKFGHGTRAESLLTDIIPQDVLDKINACPEKINEPVSSVEVIPQHEITIGGVKVKLPVKPYPCQIAVMNMLIQGCTKQQNSLLESPTGSGKTLALLCGVLAWQEQYKAKIEMEQEKIAQQSGIFQPDCFSGKYDFGNEQASHSSAGSGWRLDNIKSTFANGSRKMDDGKLMEGIDKNGDPANVKIPQIYYGTRTHKQIEQVVRELGKTIYRFKRMTILSSRDHSCINDAKRNKTELCNELLDPTKLKGCPYYAESTKRNLSMHVIQRGSGFEASWDIEDLVAMGKKLNSCPYFSARSLMGDADIIFCPYNYLIDPEIRDSMQIDLKDQVIIFDEAHNIEDICRDAASTSFRCDHLGMSAQECEKLSQQRSADSETYSTVTQFFRHLINLLNKQSLQQITDTHDTASSPCWTGEELIQLFDMYDIGEKTYPTFIQAGKAAILDYNKAKEDVRYMYNDNRSPVISQSTKRTLEHLTFALQMLTSEKFVNDYRACITESTVNDFAFVDTNVWASTRKDTQRVRTLKLICMNPAVIFAPLSLSARSIVLASGTLAPTSSFQSELGTKFPHTLSANHVVPKDQVYVRCIPRGPTGAVLKANYQNVNSWGFQDELGRLLLDVCHSVPHGVLCFFSSYQAMHTQIKRWKQGSCWNEIERVKRVFLEPRYTMQLADTMKEYRETIQDTKDGPIDGINGALLFAVFRGKVAEGIDFSDNEARCVLAIGIPYAVRLDPIVDMKHKYNDMNASKGLLRGNEWYVVQAFRALNQALGRCVRHKNDWGAVLLVDERFLMPTNISYLPKWIKSIWIESRNYNLPAELKQFVKTQKLKENGSAPTGQQELNSVVNSSQTEVVLKDNH